MRVFIPLQKVETQADGTLLVCGIASSETKDAQGETITSAAMKAALPDFFKYGTGNLREMHQLSAAGTVGKAEIQEDGSTYIEATVVDPVAIAKVKTGTYKGFSVGGGVTGRDKANKTLITGIRLSEISLVDRPCNPDSVITLVKLEDALTTDAADLSQKDAINALAKVLNEKQLTPQKIVELCQETLAKAAREDVQTSAETATSAETTSPAAAGNPAESNPGVETIPVQKVAVVLTGDLLAKGMSDLRTFADLLQSAAGLAMGSAGEAEWEQDSSPVPAALRSWITAGCKIFADMTAEETAELVASLKPTKKADTVDDLQKAATAQAAQIEDLVKAALAEPLTKLAAVTEQLSKAEDRIKQLEAQPAPGKALLKAIGKVDDIGAPGDDPVSGLTPVLKADGTEDSAATLIKGIHALGGRPVRN